MKKITAVFMSAVLSVMLFSGCTVVSSGIAYTIYPIGYLIDRLAGLDSLEHHIGSFVDFVFARERHDKDDAYRKKETYDDWNNYTNASHDKVYLKI